jgi:ligand-binding sensor domain-containing protein/AraC-like DNA-binding protein
MAGRLHFFQKLRCLRGLVLSLTIPFVLTLHAVAALAQENPLRDRLVENWNSSNGLPSDIVFCLEQTPDGYLWIGTQRGLVRSDGLRHETLLSRAVYDLCVGKDGTLWVCLGDGLLRYQKGRFTPIGPNADSPWPAYRVFEDMRGDLWVGSGSALRRLKAGLFEEFSLPGNTELSSVTAIKEDSRGFLWVGTIAGGLFRGHDGIFTRWDVGWPRDYSIFRIREGRDGALWVTTNFGLIRIQEDQPLILTDDIGLSVGYILDFIEDSEGNLFCSTARGLNLLRPEAGGGYRATLITPSSLVFDVMFEDREQNLWISCPRTGMKCYKRVPFRTLAEESGIPSYSSAVLASRDGTVWIGDNVGTLFRMKDGLARRVLTLGYSPEAWITSMAEDSQGRLWLGTSQRGVFRVEGGKAVRLNAGKPLPHVLSILPDSRGWLWYGFRDGLACLRNGALKVYTHTDGLPSDWVWNVLEGSDGSLWIATSGGLAVLRHEEWDRANLETFLVRMDILTLLEDEDRVLWAGTRGGGLVRIRNGEITRCGRDQGLGSNTVYQIRDDGAGYLWLNTPDGVIRVAKSPWPETPDKTGVELESTVYGKSDGARGESGQYSTGNSIAQTPDGTLWFALDDGMSVIQPRKIEVNKALPTPIITRVLLNFEEIAPDRNGAAFQGIKDVRFDFAAPSFVSPQRVRLRYRLEGRDSDWHLVENAGDRFASYKNLRFGSYRFRVAASNSDHIWNHEDAVFAFSLAPYFYQTWPFRAGALVMAVVLGVLAYLGLQRTIEQRRLRRRYRNSTLSPDKAEECARDLVRLFEKEKVFRTPDLSLASLSKRLGISAKDLSRIINERFDRNFWTLVNSHRVEEARSRIREAKNGDQTILDIALEVGFNSLAAFNRAFKRFVGTTPSNYRKLNSQTRNDGR